MSPRILLVDDHPALRKGVAAIIAYHHLGTVIGEAQDGEQAIQKVQELAPDLVIMDISMPRMGGLEATKEIRKFASPGLKILILTTHIAAQMILVALQSGADLLVEKTAPQEDLVKAIALLSVSPELGSPNSLLEAMVAARGEWRRESRGHADALDLFKDTGGNSDGSAALHMAATRETRALRRYRAAVNAWAAGWRRAE